jgi:tetratricopeptide (TPR) repeat protein
MKKIIKSFLGVVSLLVLTQCELVDPTTGVINPNITVDKVIGQAGSTTAWLNGQERQMALVYNSLIVNLEIASDNYDNTNTFFDQQFDELAFSFKSVNVNTLQFTIADLRQSVITGLDVIFPADPTGTPVQQAELYFYKGWAELLAGEIFVALPLIRGSVAATPAQNIDAAIADFEEAETLAPTNASYKLALARAYYAKGDKANAVIKANEAIAISADFTRTVRFDATNLPTNTMQDALYDRGTFDDLQPLPRLDFLDPKYYGRSGSIESNVYIQKMEEAHLILAEAQLSDAQLATAQETMKDVIALVNTRAKDTFNDNIEGRTQGAPGSRPNDPDVDVRASATDAFRSGLVLSRAGNVTVSVISGTSVTDAMVDAVATEDEALELLYLLRQEIFLAEGRRFADLGLRFPISEVEKLSNSNITDAQTVGFVPAFVPTNMDAFTYDAAAEECTITVNMNRVLVQNKASNLVLPFHN